MDNILTIRLPKSLHDGIEQLTKTEGMSINQFLITAAEKMSALLTQNYLEKEALKGKREYFDKVLKAVPAVEPEDYDKID
ncbi:MAG: toxin-antitoxin system HicB family antitoxin [PVC group bacterium]|nr:toxin-antitoxin system HicB family antitoxin [PVC group bacterium]